VWRLPEMRPVVVSSSMSLLTNRRPIRPRVTPKTNECNRERRRAVESLIRRFSSITPSVAATALGSEAPRWVAIGRSSGCHVSLAPWLATLDKRRLIIIGGAALVAVAVALFAVWWFVLRSNAPAAVSLDEAVAAVTSTSHGSSTSGVTTTPVSEPAISIDGTWGVVAGNGSFAGYRVEEELARIGFTTAAARSADLEASLVIDGGVVIAVDVVVNMQRLESDSDKRDNAIRDQALETDAFPTGSFHLTEAVDLPAGAASGEPFSVIAVGDLEVHGVTNRVELALEAQLVDGVIAVIGSTPMLFADYDIPAPRAPILLSVDDNGEMEFQLLFEN